MHADPNAKFSLARQAALACILAGALGAIVGVYLIYTYVWAPLSVPCLLLAGVTLGHAAHVVHNGWPGWKGLFSKEWTQAMGPDERGERAFIRGKKNPAFTSTS